MYDKTGCSLVPFDRPKPSKNFAFRDFDIRGCSLVPFDRKSSLGADSRMERPFETKRKNLRGRSIPRSSLGADSQANGTTERPRMPKPAKGKKKFGEMRQKKAKKKEAKIHKACLAIFYKAESGAMTGIIVPFCRAEFWKEKEKALWANSTRRKKPSPPLKP
jgi:hypothetical protein